VVGIEEVEIPEEVSLEVATEEVESLEEVDLGKAIQSEFCGMAHSVLRTAKTSRLSCCFPLG
jgi:hypothetical protein